MKTLWESGLQSRR